MGWIALVVAWVVVSPVAALVLSRAMRDRRPPTSVAPPPPVLVAHPEPTLTEESMVVTAHGLANSCSVVVDAGETLRARWSDMAPDQRDEVLAMMVEQTRLVQQVLLDLTGGVADDVRRALDHLERPLSVPTAEADGRAARP
jgi:hypothetical protein